MVILPLFWLRKRRILMISDSWVEKLKVLAGRKLKPQKRSLKAKAGDES